MVSKSFSTPPLQRPDHEKAFFYSLLSLPASHTIYYFIAYICLCYLFIRLLLLDLSDLFYIHIHADSAFYQMAPISTLSKRFVSYLSYLVLICQIFLMWFLDVIVSFVCIYVKFIDDYSLK